MNHNNYIFYILTVLFFFSCSKEENSKSDLLAGLWSQEKVTEDGVEIGSSALSLLFESNGVYRSYAKDMPANKEHFGAWSVTDNQWLEMTIDTWRLNSDPIAQKPENQWAKNHIPVRFTIMKISGNELEIRIKTFVGEKKYAALFVEDARPPVTSENLEAIKQEYMSLKTYIYTFKKINN
jgi:hypothetical protein